MTTNFGEGTAQRTCAAADRTGHAILHTLYQQSLKHDAEFYIEYFATDLLMDEDGACRGVIAWDLAEGTLALLPRPHGGAGQRRLWPHLLSPATSAHTCTGDGQRHGGAGRICPSRIWNSFNSIPPASTVPAV